MAITLADFARLTNEPLKRGVIDVFRKESNIMDYLPWEGTGRLAIEVLRSKTAPVPTWRKINATFTESKGALEPVSERVFDIGGMVDIDKMYVRAEGQIIDARAYQMDLYSTAIAYAFNDAFVNGDPTVNEDSIVGFWYRLVNLLPSAQTVLGGGLDISLDAASLSANEDTFLEYVSTLIHRGDGHKVDVLAMNEQLMLRFDAIIRKKGLWNQSADQFGKKVTRYGPDGPILIDLGFTTPDGTTQIIGNVENNAGTAKTGGGATSMYALKFGDSGKYVTGMYEYEMDVVDVGLLDNGVQYRSVIDWPVGIYHASPRAVARLVGIVVV